MGGTGGHPEPEINDVDMNAFDDRTGSEGSDSKFFSQSSKAKGDREPPKDAATFTYDLPAYKSHPNLEDRWAQQTLAPGEPKIETETDNRVPNCQIFTFAKEGHTLGNMLRGALVEHPHVIFAAYAIPHPMIPYMKLRVQTDGQITPKDVVVECSRTLMRDLEVFRTRFTREMEIHKIARQNQAGGDAGAGGDAAGGAGRPPVRTYRRAANGD